VSSGLHLAFFLARLTANAKTIAALVHGVSDEQARWKPSPEEWSILEIVNHLSDEEREDFRTRVDFTLHRPEAAWPSIDPEGWVAERGYQQRDPATSLEAFLSERRASLEWLASLQHPDWDSIHHHPALGSMTAGEVLGAWLAHDHLHLRQLNQLHWQYLSLHVSQGSLDYAGGW
jgi:hypothetical protein